MAKKDQLEELSSDELKSILDEESENIDPSSKTDDKDKAEEQPKKKSKRLVEIDNPYEKFKNYKDFCDRCEVTKIANIKTVAALEKEGALDFNQKRWLARVEKYNVSLYGRSL